jgi:branched-chain amino acid transport system ATP-binding protein
VVPSTGRPAVVMLEVRGLRLGYGSGLEVVHSVSFEVSPGQVVALLGANGAGKSTIMRGISGLLKPIGGAVLLDGVDIVGMPAHQVVAAGLRHVPEGRRVFGPMTVRENLVMGGYDLRRHPRLLRSRLDEVLDLFPRLRERQRQLAGMLSGGEQQMLAVGRALMTHPRVLALDEPSLGLSPLMSHEILRTVGDLAASGTAVLLVEQNVREALRVAETAHVLELGSIVLSGPAADLVHDPRVQATYLGGSPGEDAPQRVMNSLAEAEGEDG